jgi:hypothetical protein
LHFVLKIQIKLISLSRRESVYHGEREREREREREGKIFCGGVVFETQSGFNIN